jgi:hypothetical protein
MRLLVLVGICGADGGSLIIAILFGILSSALVYEDSINGVHIFNYDSVIHRHGMKHPQIVQ